jgi:hypothetical protein
VPLLADVPQSRLFDEMLKLLQTGHALASIEQLKKLGLAPRHVTRCWTWWWSAPNSLLSSAALQDTDRRVGEGKPVAPSFLLACVLWPMCGRLGAPGGGAAPAPPFPALQEAIDEVFRRPHRRCIRRRQAGQRHARDLDDAAALREACRQHAVWTGRAAALSGGL